MLYFEHNTTTKDVKMIDDMTDFLIECFKEGSFSKVEARNIINSHKFAEIGSLEIDSGAEMLFDDFIESHYFDRLNITQEACKRFLDEIEKGV
jgi:hypothetical protein